MTPRCSDCGAVMLPTLRWYAWRCPVCDYPARPYDWDTDGE